MKEPIINRRVFSMNNHLIMLETASVLECINSQDELFLDIKHIPDDLFVLFCSNSLRMVLLQSQSLAGWKKRTRESSTLWRREESHRPNREESRSWAWPRDSTLLSLVCPYE
ncbi:uncharacterized protein LOC111777245 isoform X1 [Cucurbita pepo subsp. pepo]|uniref:uncharacterized protein LOC111777245 isoform X1 n=1 Tax=Cucurbita pepo subsp. pepo TaxID=3664 RepID=UPI000C9D4264|nr:uncharacterized protein LOC111777245 isoform X1 [Cucurbita pepo subsp. pepo]